MNRFDPQLEFYTDLFSFSDFSRIGSLDTYRTVPLDWWVIITDVQGSTKAIQEGRYKEVNLVGAAAICAVQNLIGHSNYPFVFGGDGATFCLPEEIASALHLEFKRLIQFSMQQFGLRLRVGMVPVKEIVRRGHELRLAKYQLSPGNYLAQFSGTGLTCAEEMVKSKAPQALLLCEENLEELPNLEGLSCRLKPLKHKRGTILSLLIKPKGPRPQSVLNEVFAQFSMILGPNYQSELKPVDSERLRWSFFSKNFLIEQKFKALKKKSLFQSLKALLLFIATSIILEKKLNILGFSAEKYRRELLQNSDFQKYDEILRMVLDCSLEQSHQIKAFLHQKLKEGVLFFGTHESDEALMTCMVQSATQNQHIHFIDGSNGGYAMAALQLKSQIKA